MLTSIDPENDRVLSRLMSRFVVVEEEVGVFEVEVAADDRRQSVLHPPNWDVSTWPPTSRSARRSHRTTHRSACIASVSQGSRRV